MTEAETVELEERAITINKIADDIVKCMVKRIAEHGDDDPQKIDMIAASMMLVIQDLDKLCNGNFGKIMATLIDYDQGEKKKKMN
jgi:hypothetical protein